MVDRRDNQVETVGGKKLDVGWVKRMDEGEEKDDYGRKG